MEKCGRFFFTKTFLFSCPRSFSETITRDNVILTQSENLHFSKGDNPWFAEVRRVYCNMLKCLRKILEMQGSAGLYVTTKGATSSESLGLVCNVLAREILESLRNCSSRNIFFQYLFFFSKGQYILFDYDLHTKQGFQDYKNLILIKSKMNCIFAKGVYPRFWSKIGIFFPGFFLFKRPRYIVLWSFTYMARLFRL